MSSKFEPSLAPMLRLSDSTSRPLLLGRAFAALGLVFTLAPAGCGGGSANAGRPTTANSGDNASFDAARCDDKGKQVVAADTNGDGKPDVLKLYTTVQQNGQSMQVLVCRQVDMNHDGKLDIVYHYDDAGVLVLEEFDLDFDGRFEARTFYQSGRRVREEKDMNYDGRVDFTDYYENGKLVRIELDTNGDGRVDEWRYYEGGKLDRIGYDTAGSGRVDKWERAPDAEAATAAASPPAAAAPEAPPATPPAPAK
jgi:hypothetical protein